MAGEGEYRIYISSTIDDLKAERKAAEEVASKYGRLVDSYRLTEQAHVAKCIADVRSADLYIGILGRRYGWIVEDPPGGEPRSITELEYEACEHAGERRIPRLMLLRTVTRKADDDAQDGKFAPAERDKRRQAVDRFWARAARTGIEFETPEQLRAKLVEAVIAARQAHFGGRGLLEHQRHWASALAPLALMSVAGAGADDDARVRLIAAQADVFRHTPLRVEDAELLWQAESGVPDAQPPGGLRHAQAGALLIGRDGLKRLDSAERVERVGRVLAMTARRCGKAFVIGLDIASGDLPASWRPAEMLTLGGAALMAQPEATAASLVQRLHDAGAFARQTQLSVPLLVIAPDDTEAAALAGSAKATLAGFADKDERAQRTRQLRHVAAANRKADAVWPVGYYRATREQWRCFGGAGAADIVAGALKTIRVEGAQLVLRPYALGEFLDDVDGSRRIVRAACEAGALVLIDELALLHPKLSAAADELLARERCAVATVSVVDPAHSPTSALIGGVSYLRVGIVVARFGELRDLQCELHLNSATRLERWLLGAIPRLVADLAGHHPRPTLAQRADELLP